MSYSPAAVLPAKVFGEYIARGYVIARTSIGTTFDHADGGKL